MHLVLRIRGCRRCGQRWACRGRVGVEVVQCGDSYTVHPKVLNMSSAICDRPDVSAFARLDGLGLEATGQRIEPDHAVFACRIIGEDRWCRRCGC